VTRTSELHATDSPDSPLLSHANKGARLVYRGFVSDGDGNPIAYQVQPPGLPTTAWISADDVTTTNPSGLPPSKPLRLLDPGLGDARPCSSMTTGAHG
jgi:hypothetical protein